MKSRLLYLLSVFSAFIFYLFYNGYLSFMFFIFIFIVPLISFLLSFIGYFKTTIQMTSEHEVITINQQSNIIIYRDSPLLPVGKIQFDLRTTQSLSNEVYSVHYQFVEDEMLIIMTGQHCGKMEILLNNLYFSDYFHLISLKKKQKSTHTLVVLPLVQDIQMLINKLALFEQNNILYDPHRPGDDYSELFEIRTYHDGDPINRIHWKLTNKYQQLMIKEGSLPIDSQVVLSVNLTYDATKNDHILSLFHSLALYLCLQDITFDIVYKVLKDPRIHTISIINQDQYDKALYQLMSLNLEKNYPLYQNQNIKVYHFHYHVDEHGIHENNQLIRGDQ